MIFDLMTAKCEPVDALGDHFVQCVLTAGGIAVTEKLGDLLAMAALSQIDCGTVC